MERLKSEDGQVFIKNLASFVRTHEQALANALTLRRPSKNHQSVKSVKSAKLTLTPHHLFYLLSRFQDMAIGVGPMNVRLEDIHTEVSHFYSQLLAGDRPSTEPFVGARNTKSSISDLWSSLGLGSKDSISKSEKAKVALEADLKYLYSAFTKIPCLQLAPDRHARLIRGYEEFPFDTAIPLHSFKNLSALEIIDIDCRAVYGWDRLSEQLRSLTIKRTRLDDLADLLTRIVLDDKDRRRHRASGPQRWTSSTPEHTSNVTRGSRSAVTPMPNTAPIMRASSEGASRTSVKSMPNWSSTRHIQPRSRGQSAQTSPADHSDSSPLPPMPPPPFLPSSNWRFLRHLGLPDNSLTSISAPSLAPVARTLYSLDLSSNLLIEVPDSLASLIALRALNLSFCMIESLHSLSRNPLPAVTALNLRGNRLCSLAGIERLMCLERVDLRDNNLVDPAEVVRLTGLPDLREIWVDGNPFVKTHPSYRVIIMNLFRRTPGYTEDIIVDNRGPGYTERRQLVERVTNHLPSAPLSPPSPSALSYAEVVKVDGRGPGYNERKPLARKDLATTIGSESQSMSDPVFSVAQHSLLDNQTLLTDLTAPTAPGCSGSELDDARTVYSDTLTMDGSAKNVYVNELVRELLKAVSSFQLDSASMKRVADAMPTCLKAFSTRLSSTSASQQDRKDVTAFIHKYRHEIANAFNDSLEGPSTEARPIVDDNMPLNDKMELWLRHDAGDLPPPPVVDDDEEANPSKNRALSDMDEEANWEAYPVMPGLQKYRECVLHNPAYDWLIGDIRKHCLLEPFDPNILADLSSSILRTFPSRTRFSRQESEPVYQMTYALHWDLVSFLDNQEYSEGNAEALPRVVTFTGSRKRAQALTCSEYLHQTWPSSAGTILKLLQALLRSELRDMLSDTLPDGTNLVAWFPPFVVPKDSMIMFEVKGSTYSIAEVGQQLGWLVSALQSSPQPDQVVYCQPRVENLTRIHERIKSGKKQNIAAFSADISVIVKGSETSSKINGQCWYDLVRSGVVVEGFPISRRPEITAVKGLEIPLPMMACLAQASYVNTFLGNLVIKGFASMLIPTETTEEMIVWHLVHKKHGDRISYLDSTVHPVQGLSASHLSRIRHILGWCSNARHLAGTRDAAYDISSSHLPKLRGDGLLAQAFIYNGQMIKGDAPFLVGYKDRPLHVSRGGYVRKLKWIMQKSVVLWDEEAKRGWLLNGASALLHLVRASILHDTNGPFNSECCFKWEVLEEQTVGSKNAAASAITVLLNRTNRALTIYEGKDDLVTFENRVEHFLNILEQMFDYQVHAAGPDGSGYNSKAIPRAYFEGWDFQDLATELDSLRPRRAILTPSGKAWVDFTRSIHAVNLLGRNFGDILSPSDISCPHWASLPKDQYYLAAGMSDLQSILEYTGDLTTSPIRLSENLVWHNSEMAFQPCGCVGSTTTHADIVQVILPDTLSAKSETFLQAEDLPHKGAVVFGYNRNFQWRWGDTGDPERDEVTDCAVTPLSPTIDIKSTKSNSLSVGSDSDVIATSSTLIHSTVTDITIHSDPAEDNPAQPKPLVRSYTRWRLESLTPQNYAVGIVCALPLELLAIRALFDQTHPDLSLSAADPNHYALGSMGRHKVVAACLPDGEYGTNSAADVAANLRRSFPMVKVCLLVGIGGGVPSSRSDIRLGDVVVSKPNSMGPGVIQYDMGKALENGKFQQIGVLQPPPRLVMTALSSLKSDPYIPRAPLQEYIEEITACRKEYRYPGAEHDRLFSIHYSHSSMHPTCDSCSAAHAVKRPSRSDHHPRVHYGLIASGNQVMRDPKLRDRWSTERDILCFEMEAAGIMNTLPCLVIRGICDYSDSHKNKRFQEYAAATAASYAKLLLSYMKDTSDVDATALCSKNEDQGFLGVFRRALSFMG